VGSYINENEFSNLSKRENKFTRRRDYRFAYPEFLPDPERVHRNDIREKLERQDMIARRENVALPEFYVGSIVAVTTTKSKSDTPSKETRFVGIVIDRGGSGLRAWILVRNVIENIGVEFMFDLYAPSVKELEVLRLEKRLDDELYYLRDCDQKYSTFPTDMIPEMIPENQSVPINDLVVPLGPKPWCRRWDRYIDRLSGYSYDPKYFDVFSQRSLSNYHSYLSQGWNMEYVKYDLMRDYFLSIPIEEQDSIWSDVGPALEKREAILKRLAAKKALSLSTKK